MRIHQDEYGIYDRVYGFAIVQGLTADKAVDFMQNMSKLFPDAYKIWGIMKATWTPYPAMEEAGKREQAQRNTRRG